MLKVIDTLVMDSESPRKPLQTEKRMDFKNHNAYSTARIEWLKATKKEQLKRQMGNLEWVVTSKLREESTYNGGCNQEQIYIYILCDNEKFPLDLANWRWY